MKKRVLVPLALAATVALAGAGCSSGDDGGAGGGGSTITVGQWRPGPLASTSLVSKMLADNTELESEHAVDVSVEYYTNLQALYTDLARGRIDVVVGGPEAFASSALQGAPISVAGSLSRSNAAILSEGEEFTEENLRGARMVAPSTTGTWAAVQLEIEDKTGLVANEDYEVVNGESPTGSIQQLAAGTADFAMSWGEAIAAAEPQFPNVEVVADAEELAIDDKPFIQFVVAMNTDNVDHEVAERLMAAYADQVAWMEENPDEVEVVAVQEGNTEGVILSMIEEGRSNFDVHAFPGPEADELRTTLQRMADAGVIEGVPGDSFFNAGK
ncbi:ABC transporter substrate-binding protein [Dietzia cinnamea]|uniref:ABC transporter substrate-binding protein n=1 Tax=Dietzia cinnamea TaxID=321318 RepID=UPI00223C2569|nr:PhnD/SsuA/transferrin family substrate-binding protein [Dietzia cinnamea]MCT2061424.1 PhnD/SsuA/transferrin family substrate-binding protein [Dietzia cinnamea]MCT2236406.1 PhnD/SsuA/transferrin family substrate-binding protein [Dietzia cinnamea]MCT2300117.1 PhnD/SsuA/transferrin family substrate-binding protein [Dietzia cinnamea]